MKMVQESKLCRVKLKEEMKTRLTAMCSGPQHLCKKKVKVFIKCWPLFLNKYVSFCSNSLPHFELALFKCSCDIPE